MNLFYVPDLENLSIVVLTISVFNANKMIDLEKESKHPLFALPDENLEATINDIMSHIKIPKQLLQQILCFIRPISLEVENWKNRHREMWDRTLDLRSFLSWKSEGTIDRYKTAITVVQSEALCIKKRFVMSCYYCLGEQAESLWKSMSEPQKRELFHEFAFRPSLVKYYIAKIQKRNIGLRVYYCHTVAALRYLLRKTCSENHTSTLFTAMRNNFGKTDVVRFCLSQMEEDQQMKAFAHHPFQVLKCFWEWPWQPQFINVASRLWNHLSKINFLICLEFIIQGRILPGWKDFDYKELLHQFWLQSPSSFKDHAEQDKHFDVQLLKDILASIQVS